MMTDIQHIKDFLGCPTPVEWLQAAQNEIDILIIDHAHCEKKAASTALNMMYRYVDRSEMLHKLSQLAREELLHFEQVIDLLEQRQIKYDHLSPSRYAAGMRQPIRTSEPGRLIDHLIVGGFIEARSCERFEALIPYVDDELGKYYAYLLKSESRHYEDYLELAELYSPEPIADRVALFREVESELILAPDTELRFHSGPPQT